MAHSLAYASTCPCTCAVSMSDVPACHMCPCTLRSCHAPCALVCVCSQLQVLRGEKRHDVRLRAEKLGCSDQESDSDDDSGDEPAEEDEEDASGEGAAGPARAQLSAAEQQRKREIEAAAALRKRAPGATRATGGGGGAGSSSADRLPVVVSRSGMREGYLGAAEGVRPGYVFSSREDLHHAGVHRGYTAAPVWGSNAHRSSVCALTRLLMPPADSLCLSPSAVLQASLSDRHLRQ